MEAESPRLRCLQGWFLIRALSLSYRWPSSMSSHVVLVRVLQIKQIQQDEWIHTHTDGSVHLCLYTHLHTHTQRLRFILRSWLAQLCRKRGFDPGVGKIPWRRKWQPTLVFLPGKSHGQRSLVGYSAWGPKELDTTEYTYAHTNYPSAHDPSLFPILEGVKVLYFDNLQGPPSSISQAPLASQVPPL